MKLMFICKKHYRQLMDEFRKYNTNYAVNAVLKDEKTLYILRGIDGFNIRIHIKPYLKKLYILSRYTG